MLRLLALTPLLSVARAYAPVPGLSPPRGLHGPVSAPVLSGLRRRSAPSVPRYMYVPPYVARRRAEVSAEVARRFAIKHEAEREALRTA